MPSSCFGRQVLVSYDWTSKTAQAVLNASHRVCLKKMAARGSESNDLLSESSFIEDFVQTSESSSLLQSSPEPQQVGRSGTDQNLSNAVNQQMKVSSAPSRKESDSSSVLQSSPELQQLDSLQTDQNLSNDQIKILLPPAENEAPLQQVGRMIIARKHACNG